MTSRLTAITLALSLATGGCVTTTAHQLILSDNPLRDQAVACERECRWLRAPAGKPCEQAFGGESCTQRPDEDRYAACLDTCPGARAIDGTSCPDPAAAGAICVETTRASRAAIGGGLLGAGGIAGGVIIVSAIAAIATSPWWLLLLFLAH